MSRFSVLTALSLLLMLSACAKRVECNVHGGDNWLDAQTDRFHIRSNLPEAELRQEGERLEALLNVLHGVHGTTGAKHDSERVEVIILARREQLEEYTDVLGYAVRGGLFVLAAADKEEDEARKKAVAGWKLSSTLTHELAHHVHADVLVRSPRWIAEGLATYEETIELNQDRTSALVGAEPSGRLCQRGAPARRAVAVGTGRVEVERVPRVRLGVDLGPLLLQPEEGADERVAEAAGYAGGSEEVVR